MIEFVGRFGIAHGCPIGPSLILTSAHVTDKAQPDAQVRAVYPLRMSDSAGREQVALPDQNGLFVSADFAIMRPDTTPLSRWFVRVKEAPKPGDKLWTVGYEHENRKEFMRPKTISATVTRVIAGHVSLTASAGPGSSGACWVNARGEAVAMGSWGPSCGVGDPCAMAVGIWPPWVPEEAR
jgi:hypothetical protein